MPECISSELIVSRCSLPLMGLRLQIRTRFFSSLLIWRILSPMEKVVFAFVCRLLSCHCTTSLILIPDIDLVHAFVILDIFRNFMFSLFQSSYGTNPEGESVWASFYHSLCSISAPGLWSRVMEGILGSRLEVVGTSRVGPGS